MSRKIVNNKRILPVKLHFPLRPYFFYFFRPLFFQIMTYEDVQAFFPRLQALASTNFHMAVKKS